jgi:hypothetical protein
MQKKRAEAYRMGMHGFKYLEQFGDAIRMAYLNVPGFSLNPTLHILSFISSNHQRFILSAWQRNCAQGEAYRCFAVS